MVNLSLATNYRERSMTLLAVALRSAFVFGIAFLAVLAILNSVLANFAIVPHDCDVFHQLFVNLANALIVNEHRHCIFQLLLPIVQLVVVVKHLNANYGTRPIAQWTTTTLNLKNFTR
jgi:hypothetical protein